MTLFSLHDKVSKSIYASYNALRNVNFDVAFEYLYIHFNFNDVSSSIKVALDNTLIFFNANINYGSLLSSIVCILPLPISDIKSPHGMNVPRKLDHILRE